MASIYWWIWKDDARESDFFNVLTKRDGLILTQEINHLKILWNWCTSISENLNKNFLWFKFIHPPNNKNHMDYIISSFNKILINILLRKIMRHKI